LSEASRAAAAFPRSLTGRVLLIIFAGLVVAHVASFVLFEAERARALNRFAATEVAARIAEYVRTSSTSGAVPSPSASGASPSRPGSFFRSRLRWQDVEALGDPPAGSEGAAAAFSSELRRLLTEHFQEDPVVWISARDAQPGEGPFGGGPRPDSRFEGGRGEGGRVAFDRPPRGEPPFDRNRSEFMVRPPGGGFAMFTQGSRLVTVALKLPGGRQSLAETLVPKTSVQIPAEAWISIALIFVVTALFSIWAVRLAVQPVRMLADAADRLSRNIDEPPLPEKGAAEIRAAARAFNRMQDRLKRHVNSRALAFAAMSHDIRTPLTRMRLRLESLDERAKAKLADDVGEIEAIAKSVLEVTRGLSPDEKVVDVDLGALVRRLLADYEMLDAKIGVSGSCAPVGARPTALRRALGNLIDNALKYGSEVTVELAETREHVAVRVCDRGPGIPAQHLDKVTYPFYRVESSRNRGTGGAGLGLAIAKDIVEGHGGELLVENREGGGLCVTIRLPR
jgi:signal transduction histidine kinase